MRKCFLNLNFLKNRKSFDLLFKKFSVKNKISSKSTNNFEISSTNLFYKIFDSEYLKNFYLFMTKITKKYNNSSLKKNSIYLEKEIFKFLYKDKNISSPLYDIQNLPIDEMNKMSLTSTQATFLVRKNFITQTSYFIEMCFENKLFSPNFTEFNKILFYYMTHHQNIANRKIYPSFNINLIFYFVENPNYENSFKRLVIMKLLENIDILKFTQFIELTDKLSEFVHKSKLSTELFHPFNPLKLDQTFISNLIDKESGMKFNDILKTLSMSQYFPLKEKIFLVEKILPKLDLENYIDIMYTNQILYFIKSYKNFKCELKEKNISMTLESKDILDELYLKIINKLKFRFKKITVERFCELGLDKVYSIIDDFTSHAKYIDDQEIIEDFLSIVIKSSEKYDSLKADMKFILQKFLHVHPSFAIKSLVNYWLDLILGNFNLSYLDTLCIIKCIMFTHNNPHVIFDLEKLEDQFKVNLLNDYIRGLYTSEKIKCVNNFEEFVELFFYLTFISHYKIFKIEENLNSQTFQNCQKFGNFFLSNLEILLKNILSKFEINKIFDLDTNINDEELKISEILNEVFLHNDYSEKTLDFIFLICELYENKVSNMNMNMTSTNNQRLINLNILSFIKMFKEKYIFNLSKDLNISKLEKKLTKLFHKYNPELFKEKKFQIRLNKIIKFSENIHNYYVNITLIDLNKKENEILIILDSPIEARREIPSEILHAFYIEISRPKITKIITVSYDQLLDSLKDYYSNIIK